MSAPLLPDACYCETCDGEGHSYMHAGMRGEYRAACLECDGRGVKRCAGACGEDAEQVLDGDLYCNTCAAMVVEEEMEAAAEAA